jgi:2-hydroxy-3-keto-5-methylthiopentenyl-1-phosphate phosphatase
MRKYYLLVSDFDQTLSFNDSGQALAEMLGIPNFQEKVANLSRLNLVQSGAELTYLLRHDPDFRRVREADLIEVGRQIRLKRNIALLAEFLKDGIEGFRFDFYVVSAAPWLVVHSALEGLVPPDHIIGAHFSFSPETGEVESIIQVPAGYGKVAAVDSLRLRLGVPSDRIVYVGDRGVRSETHRANRATHGDQRRRTQRSDSDPGRDRRLRSVPDSPGVRGAGTADSGMGSRSDGLAHHPGWLFHAWGGRRCLRSTATNELPGESQVVFSCS